MGGGRLGLVVVVGALGGEGSRAIKCMGLKLPDTMDASLSQVSSCSSSLLLCSGSLLCGSAKKVVPLSKSSQDSTDSTIIGSVVDAFDLGTAAGARLRLARRDQGPWRERLVVLLISNRYNRRQVVRGGGKVFSGGGQKELLSPRESTKTIAFSSGRVHILQSLQVGVPVPGTTCKHANKLFNTKMCSLNVCMCAITNLTSSLSITTTSTYKNLLCTGVPVGTQHTTHV